MTLRQIQRIEIYENNFNCHYSKTYKIEQNIYTNNKYVNTSTSPRCGLPWITQGYGSKQVILFYSFPDLCLKIDWNILIKTIILSKTIHLFLRLMY